MLGSMNRHAAAVVLLVAGAGWPWHHHHTEPRGTRPAPVPLHVRTVGAWLCEGTLIAGYNLERLDRNEWVFVQDQGRGIVQTAPVTGRWVTLPSTSGGEGLRRVPVATVPAGQAVRVVYDGVAASPRLAAVGCPG